MRQELISGWGGCPRIKASLYEIHSKSEISLVLEENQSLTPRGMGRSYGDSSLGTKVLVTPKMNRLLSFDGESGILECEAGVCLEELIRVFVPKGWFLPVTPGTRFVTVGGMFASDVHGKNHHKSGSFSKHVLSFTLLDASGHLHEVDRQKNLELFLATAGGMGLTGMILKLRFQMIPVKSSWIRQTVFKMKALDELLDHFDSTHQYTYSVAWVDCLSTGKDLGRSLLMLGEHAAFDELPADLKNRAFSLDLRQKLKVPVQLPSGILNTWSIKTFNSLYYHRIRSRENSQYVPLLSYFYPLDNIHHWNRIYGRKGFYQYQCVIPKKPDGSKQLRRLLQQIADSKTGSFLAILKLFGPRDEPYLSFASEGYTLALDFPNCSGTEALFQKLDEIVVQSGGRLYLTKDARMSKSMFEAGYLESGLFKEVKRRIDPENRFTSLQAERLGLIA